ncbi:hypothetical protein KBB76_00375 [Candidatus Saccharibacteria bacterium]|jgi:cytochrome bd-type quinol oxidase subunit 2|nr:hypothetical protein [Candidatus Saccharibacteria bacterium]HOR23624.1 DUF5652 family protein [Candidatus Saccharibacteria bacterium]HPW47768.1 DUF5652 family protein [Candidatus Saccharibacteria bacterium]
MNEAWFNHNWWWFLLVLLWSYAWKAFALWRAARKNDKVWFVVLLLVNTAGILEIFYLFYFSKLGKKAPKTE